MKPGVKIGLGIFTSLATLGLIFYYDSFLKVRIDSAEVVVVKQGQEIMKSDPLTADKLTVERRAKDSLINGVVLASDINKIIGEDASEDIVGNSMISSDMIDFDHLVPDASKGESIRPITKSMIFAEPGSLRRKDVINIYLVYKDGSTSDMVNGTSTTPSSNQNGKTATGTTSASTVDSTSAAISGKPFLSGVKVVYVKDSGNKEVVSPADSKDTDKRLNATSTISDIEIILNDKDFNKLMDEVLGKGAQLYITYR